MATGSEGLATPLLRGFESLKELYRDETVLVLRGRSTDKHEPVILKTRPAVGAGTEHSIAQEYALLQKLSNSGATVEPLGWMHDEGMDVLVLKDIPAETTVSGSEYLRAKGALDITAFFPFAMALTRSLGRIHSRYIVHGDVKPGNFLYSVDSCEVHFFDFDLAFPILGSARGNITSPRGTFPYLAPECTGRIAAQPDHRSDLYALGVTFFQMLTDRLPFIRNTMSELLNAVLTEQAPLVSAIRPELPKAVSDIVEKLLSKDFEKRYQSAYGLYQDLSRCNDEYKSTGTVASFILGSRDCGIVLQACSQLYGREKETQAVRALYSQVRKRRVCGLFLRGEPGGGKSSLVRQLPSMVDGKVFFGHGRFEEVACQAPYRAIGAALALVLQRILSLDEAVKNHYAERMRTLLGLNASLLFQLLPNLQTLLIGPDGSLPSARKLLDSDMHDELPSQNAQARFADAVLKVITCCATRERPLLLCIDDLQWADSTSLALIAELLSGLQMSETRDLCLLFVGSYRMSDAGSSAANAMAQKLQEGGLYMTMLDIQSLTTDDVVAMMHDLFPLCIDESLRALSEVVLRKTLGNAFFVQHFLEGVYQDGLIRFDFDSGAWVFDMAGIEAARFTDNVASYLSQRLALRTEPERTLLFTAACLGLESPIALLRNLLNLDALVFDLLVATLVAAHWLIVTDATAICFSHDHLRHAAYMLYPEERRKAMHFTLAQQLLAAAHTPMSDSELFAIVQQYTNAGSAVIPEQHFAVVGLLLTACERARHTAAFDAAAEAAQTALKIVESEKQWWDGDKRSTCFKALLAVFQCQSEMSKHTEADATYELVLTRALGDDRIDAWQIRADQLELQSKWIESIVVRTQALSLLGSELSLEPTEAHLKENVQAAVHLFMHHRSAILTMPLATGRSYRLLNLFAQVIPATFHVAPMVFVLASAKLVAGCLSSGTVVPALATGLVGVATALLAVNELRLAIELGKCAQQLMEHIESPLWRCKAALMLFSFIDRLHQPFDSLIPAQAQALKHGTESGDTVAVCFLVFVGVVIKLCASVLLARLEAECEVSSKWLMRQAASSPVRRNVGLILGAISAWTDLGDPDTYDPVTRGCYWVVKLMRYHVLEQYQDAYHAAQPSLPFVKSLTWSHWFYFHYVLTLFALYPTADDKHKEQYKADIQEYMPVLDTLAAHCPQNFTSMHLLAKAEHTRVLQSNNIASAIQLYDEALLHAKQHRNLMMIGLSSELAGMFYLSLGGSVTAHAHLCTAYQAFLDWGALSKVKTLVHRLPFVDFGAAQSARRGSGSSLTSLSNASVHAQIDVESIVKASRALTTTEAGLAHVLDSVMTVILENAAAERAFILLKTGKEQMFETAARHEAAGVMKHDSVSPVALALVQKDKSVLVVENAIVDPRFGFDEYVKEKRVRSLLCFPIQTKDELTGIVYLENNSFTGAFLPARIPILSAIVSQLSISIENASMVRRLMEYSKELEKRNEELCRVDRLKTEFLATTTHELRTPLNAILGTASLLSDTPLNEEQGGYVKTIERSTVAQLHLINDLLDTSKIQAGKLRIRETPFNLYECIETAFEMVSPAAAEKDIELAYRVNCKLPSKLVGDARRLQQMMLNLLSNAIKFTEEGEVELIVHSCEPLTADRLLLVFEVRDTGIGISPSQIGDLFSLFTQLDSSSTRRYEGSGLGLYLTARLASLMNGAVSVTSDGVHGSVFHVQLLLGVCAATPRGSSAGLLPSVAVLDRKHVLVVASHAANREVFASLLPTVGATVDCVPSERRSTRLPDVLAADRVARADVIVAELAFIAQLLEMRSTTRTQALVPLVTSLQWTKQQQKHDLCPLIKPLSHLTLLRVLNHAYEQTRRRLIPVALPPVAAMPILAVSRANVLVVDDNAVNNKVLCQILNKIGFTSKAAFNGVEAVAAMAEAQYDIVLMDLLMPVMDGFDCTRELRKKGYMCPIVATSATINEEACVEAGMSDFLHKPISKASVLAIMDKCLTSVSSSSF